MIRRTLMKRNQELAEFEVDPATGEARVIDALEADFDPLVSAELLRQGDNPTLTQLIKFRAITRRRLDWANVLASFGALSPVHLALMGHGLSLSDQYWYRAPGSTERWEDINFFDNDWDPGFGEAVLSGDYARLAFCSPDVPDATTAGRVIKAWERNDEGTFLVKFSIRSDGADLMGAKLASDLCAALFDEGRYVPLKIVERYGRPCSASPLMLASDEELVNGNRLCALAGIQDKSEKGNGGMLTTDRCRAIIDAYATVGISDASAHVARMACLSCLAMLANFHAENFGAIWEADSSAWRAAPVFDYNGSFGFIRNLGDQPRIFENPDVYMLFCGSYFSFLDPSWDWSWYDPRALDDFEDRIVEAYAPYQSLSPSFVEFYARLFVTQREYVNKVASAQT